MAISYIEKSEFISKFQYESDKDKYEDYEKYPLEDKIIISKNENPFVSVYDIAFYCKKEFKGNKLFLIAHRFINEETNDKFVEFFIFNTQNIFDKALTSYMTVKYEELFEKRHLIQEMISISKKLLDVDDLFVILGDNLKQHDVLEYLNLEVYPKLEEEKEEKKVDLLKINLKISKNKEKVKFEKISKILNKVKISEKKESKNKKLLYIIIVICFSIFFAPDIGSMLTDDYKKDIKRETKNDKRLLRKLQNDVSILLKNSRQLRNETAIISKKSIYKEKSK